MKPAPFTYEAARDIAHGLSLFDASEGEAKYLAGGQTLGPMINLRLTQPDHLIDVSRLDELKRTEEHNGSVVLGASIRHAEVEDGKVPDPSRGLMRRAARGLAYRAVRNRGTLGGSIAHADPVAEWPNILTALAASVRLRGLNGDRELPMDEFLQGYLTTAIRPDEIVLEFAIPKLGEGARTGFNKFCRKAGEFAHSLAVCVIRARGDARCVLGCAAGRPVVLSSVGALVAGMSQWQAGARGEIAAAMDEDIESFGLHLDQFERRTHVAVVERSIKDAWQ
jgi:aerobic carbon-monoxide dehydrogenase medium subunit